MAKKKKQKKRKKGLAKGPPHLALKLSPPPPKQGQKKLEKPKNTQKELCSYQSKISVFLFCPKKPCFDNLTQNARTPQNTIKTGVSGNIFLKNSYASRNGHFWTQKTQIQKFQLSSFFVLFLLFRRQKHKNALKPLFS